MTGVDLNTPVGRRAMEAAVTAYHPAGIGTDRHARMRDVLDAALAALTSDVCPTCGGSGRASAQDRVFKPYGKCPNPNCVNGKVQPALYTREDVLERLSKMTDPEFSKPSTDCRRGPRRGHRGSGGLV